jgi:subtilisin family serine protease
LMRHPEVASLQLDHGGRAQLMEAVPAVQAARAHSALGLTGKDVRVAILDTGVEADHPDLRGAVVAQHCFLRGGCPPFQRNEGSDATDDNGHGTSIAGVIASRGLVSAPGFAPDAEIVALKVLGADSTGSESDWVAALDWIYDNLDELKVSLVNLSFVSELLFDDGGCDRAAPALANALANLTRAGVTVFGASGNNGSSTQLAVPACNTGVIAVGASYDADVGPQPSASGTYKRLVGASFAECRDAVSGTTRLTCYTNSSPRLDLIAPGSPITSDWIGGSSSLRGGTSYAAAAATGIAALLLECHAGLDPSALRRALTETGLPLVDARNGLSFPLVQAANAARQVCPMLADAGAVPMADAALPVLDAALPTVDAAHSDAAPQATVTVTGAQQAAVDAGTQLDSGSAADDEPIAPVKLILPKRPPKPESLSRTRAAGSCACALPGHMQGWGAYSVFACLALCRCLRRRRFGMMDKQLIRARVAAREVQRTER